MAEAEEDVDLRAEPWRYPGRAIAEAVLLGVPGDGRGGHVRLLARAGRRLGKACVRLSDGDRLLNDVLLANDVAGVDARRPVVAFGSNADASVLLRESSREAVSSVVPVRPGYMSGAVLAASAHVSGRATSQPQPAGGGVVAFPWSWPGSTVSSSHVSTRPNRTTGH